MEIQGIISKLKNNEAPGPDKIENSYLKVLGESLKPIFVELFNKIIRSQQIPEQWYTSEIILLFKKGDRDKITNYRPISLSLNINEIFMKIVKNRIYGILDNNQGEEQSGFRRGYSTVDHIFTVNQLIEKTHEYKIEVYLLLLDFNKAFDSIKHSFLWQAMANQGVPKGWVEIIKKLYKNSQVYVKTDRTGPTFKMGRGVRQGDPLSPNVFNCALEEIFRKINWENKGIKINGKYINNLRFADDVILIGKSKEEIQELAEEFLRHSKEAGLTDNTSKTINLNNTKLDSINTILDMYNTNNRTDTVTINGVTLERKSEGKYLGQIIAFENRQEKELRERRKNAWCRKMYCVDTMISIMSNFRLRSYQIEVSKQFAVPPKCISKFLWLFFLNFIYSLISHLFLLSNSIVSFRHYCCSHSFLNFLNCNPSPLNMSEFQED